MSRSGILLILLATAGCASGSEPAHVAAIPRGMASMTVTRTNAPVAILFPADVEVNGATIAAVKAGATHTFPVPPGPGVLSVSCGCGPGRYSVRFNATPGAKLAFEISPRGEQVAAVLVGGIIGMAADAVASGNAGTFKLTQIP